ncbi:MAG: ArsR/SmtB family transcription factor [Sandaracinaceae bacterium]
MSGLVTPSLPLADSATLLSLLADATRVRLLALLSEEELSVAELVQVTELGQSRVSTHLGKLREAGLVSQRRAGSSTFYREHAAMPAAPRALWKLVSSQLGDPRLESDRARMQALVAARESAWPDRVAGQMERHYSPGRTWEATARAFVGLMDLGDVLDAGSGDGTLAALIAARARSVTCLDQSKKVLDAARRRLSDQPHVRFTEGDVCALPFEPACFDHVMSFNVLASVPHPGDALREAARVLRPGGGLTLVTLLTHAHADITAAYGHVHPGFTVDALHDHVENAGLTVTRCEVTSRERRAPHFEVIRVFAARPEGNAS